MPLIIDLILLCVGVYWLGTAVFTLPMLKGMSIGSGLLPAIASGILLVLLVVNIIRIFRTQKVDRAYFTESFRAVRRRELIPLAVGLGCLGGCYVLGMLLTLTGMLFCWLKFLSGYSAKKSGLVTVCVMAFLYAVFKLWLKMPLPQGLLGIL